MCQGSRVCKPTSTRVQTCLSTWTHSRKHEVRMDSGTCVCKAVLSVCPRVCWVCAGTDLCNRAVLHGGPEEPGWRVPCVHPSTDMCRTPMCTCRDVCAQVFMCKHVCTGDVGQTQAMSPMCPPYVPHKKPSPRCHRCAQNADIPSLQGLQEPSSTAARGGGHQHWRQCRSSPKSCNSTWPRT